MTGGFIMEGTIVNQVFEYIDPELIVVAVMLYFVGSAMKKSSLVKDKYIPLILGVVGILVCAVWVIATYPIKTGKEIATAIFTAVVQGTIAAGLSTYVNQIIKQGNKDQ